ncbi:pyrroloquinoline quinone biosynthesis protein PqqB [Methylibium petroleiphilum]|uniref:Coenzyme PQQ synthesis protein B n=1 Tax=Methylibium petroleiphilum (strain ATCC BAA-1232 / LMG 22953 / PM1) TaxID=420662 RepID=A2SJ00_METPP|nr:pyrroloquinoline quinone biosynthesis protein PqqB [Methylibium petroleiphilum]ABM95539.1 coenzyme PQQ synthesis protein B [Methylibium petroleiphilum PM1]
MKVLVLGSGAGGGCPQWNCNCAMCAAARNGSRLIRPRTQSSIAISPDGQRWVLLNASPDIGQQLRVQPALHPKHGLRDSPIKAVVLMDAQIDHATGLLSLREGPPIELYVTPCVFEDLTTGLPILTVLDHYCGVHWHMLPVAGEQRVAEFSVDGFETLRFRAVAIPGKAPPYSPHRHDPKVGDNIALEVTDRMTGKRLFYAPGLADVGDVELQWMRDADCLLVDGTFWTEDEMVQAGLGSKFASDMGHLPQSGSPQRGGMMDALDRTGAHRKLLIHINNSNPILDDYGAERAELARRGIEVAHDGMEIVL